MTPRSYDTPNGAPEFPERWRWLQYLLEHYGVPTVLCLALLYWFAVKIAEPLVQCHIEAVQQQQRTAQQIIETQQSQARTDERAAETLSELRTYAVRGEEAHNRHAAEIHAVVEEVKKRP